MKVLAVDDQEAVLQKLKNQIDCKKLGIDCFDTADSAKSARLYLQKAFYEIILCDIEMPEENGISFAKWVCNIFPDVKIIFLTSHTESFYLKEAISMHSFDYVFQPIITYELEEVIKKAMVQYKIESINRKYQAKGKLYQGYEEDILNLQIMKFLKDDENEKSKVENILSWKEKGLLSSHYWVPFSVQFHRNGSCVNEFNDSLLKFSIKNIVDELLQSEGLKSYVISESNDLYYGVIYGENISLTTFNDDVLVIVLKTFKDIIEKMAGCKTTLYLCETIEKVNIRAMYRYLKNAMEENADKREMILIKKNTKHFVSDLHKEIPRKLWKHLLYRGDFQALQESIVKYIEELRLYEDITVRTVIEIHKVFNSILLSYIAEKEIESEQIFTKEMPYQKYMISYKTYETFIEMVIYVTHRLYDVTGQAGNLIEDVKKYIQNHLTENITVSEIAAAAGMNSEYLTKLFRKKTGMSLKEYLTDKKMEMAKMLLRTTTLSITMIADHIGYDNYNNFIRVFKKYEDITPAEYRKNIR